MISNGESGLSVRTKLNTAFDDIAAVEEAVDALDSGKQATLVSGTNIKTINSESILGSGNIVISGGTGAVDSVNGQTGVVTLTAADVGALSEDSATTIVDTKPLPIGADTMIMFDSAAAGNPVLVTKAQFLAEITTDLETILESI